jgi:hypothetical protein
MDRTEISDSADCPGATPKNLRDNPRCRACGKCDALDAMFADLDPETFPVHYRPQNTIPASIAA